MLGKILGGRYQIDRHLGGGGFGQTYLAADLHLPGNPACVVKQLKPRMTSTESLQAARRLFDTEAQVLYTLGSHDQIPRLFAHFEDNQDFYLVQEYIEGVVLSQELKTHKQFSETEVINLLQEVLTVLEFVHQQQVVHRDIKPSNLIRRKSDRRIILIDFGAVKQIGIQSEDPNDSVTVAVGSSGYMPNEQLAGKPRFSSDIFAVGMLAIQCLTGIYPKRFKEDPKTSEIIWRDQVQVSPELADILDKMVRYDFRQRYSSATEALTVLRSLTSTAPIASLLLEPTVVSFDGHLAWLERGDELFQRQRYKEAITAYDRVVQAKPDNYLAWFKRGIALENLQRYADAAASYEQVVQLQPQDYLAWFKWGAALEHLQRYPEALQAYEQVVQLQPDNYWAWHDRGKVLENLQRLDEAVSAYDRAVQLKPDFQLAVDHRKRVLSKLKRVDALYHLQHYDEALASCDRAIQQNPEDSLAWFMRGMALENLNYYEQAVAAYDRVVEIQPDDHVAWFKRGNLLEKLQRESEAIASYYRVVQLQPDNYWAWHDRGRLLEKLKQYEEAIASYDRTLQLKPDFQAAMEGRRRVFRQLQEAATTSLVEVEEDATIVSDGPSAHQTSEFRLSDLKAAIADYKALLQHQAMAVPLAHPAEETVISHPTTPPLAGGQPEAEEATTVNQPAEDNQAEETIITTEEDASQVTDYSHWLQKGRALEKLQHYQEAIGAYDRASQIRCDDPQLWLWRGNTLNALGRYQEAIASYDRSLRLKPDNADIWCCLAGALSRLKRYGDAVTCFEQALQLSPQNHTAWYWRGRLLWELKQPQEAITSFKRALEIKPNFQPARTDMARVSRQWQRQQSKNLPV